MNRRELFAATIAAAIGSKAKAQCYNGICYNGQSCNGNAPGQLFVDPYGRLCDAYGRPYVDAQYRYLDAYGRPRTDTAFTGPTISQSPSQNPGAKPDPKTPSVPTEVTPANVESDHSTTPDVAAEKSAPPKESPQEPETKSIVVNSGWVPNPEATQAFVQRTPKEYRQQISELAREDDRSERLLYRYLLRLVMDAGLTDWYTTRNGVTVLCSYDQGNVGSCTGHATATAINVITACEIAMGGKPYEYRAMASAEAMYGIGRKQSDMLRTRGDGCYVSALVEGSEKVGTLYCMNYGEGMDLTTYSESRCRQFGNQGVGDRLEKVAGEHRTLAAVDIRSFDELRAAIRNGYPVIFGSDVGYEGERNAEGIIAARGTWNHAMAGTAIRYSDRYGWLVGIQNSWSNRWNPKGYVADEPYGFFWAVQKDVERMLKGECFALSGIQGFVRTTLPDMGTFFGGR